MSDGCGVAGRVAHRMLDVGGGVASEQPRSSNLGHGQRARRWGDGRGGTRRGCAGTGDVEGFEKQVVVVMLPVRCC
jgi:hypothetical protein